MFELLIRLLIKIESTVNLVEMEVFVMLEYLFKYLHLIELLITDKQ